MTTAEMADAQRGQDYWYQYIRLNGYAFAPTTAGLNALSRNLDLNIPHLQRCINRYLEA